MRVRITKCDNDMAWYCNNIGDEYDVELEGGMWYRVEGVGIDRYIMVDDCEVIKGPIPSDPPGDITPIIAPPLCNHNYKSLQDVFDRAYRQASSGKGHERHADGEPFENQKICEINRRLGSADGAAYQAVKKVYEAARMVKGGSADSAVRDLLGAINYIAAMVILIEGADDGLENSKRDKE